ncbi:hypothetical protein [Cohnella sp.]|uniref:hypothetical protein n=1 Tax=Cohnella sp. TaxID=1883426 RepID=UPI0035669A3D
MQLDIRTIFDGNQSKGLPDFDSLNEGRQNFLSDRNKDSGKDCKPSTCEKAVCFIGFGTVLINVFQMDMLSLA